MKLKMIIVKYIDVLVFITFLCCTFILQVELENHFQLHDECILWFFFSPFQVNVKMTDL